MNTTDDLRELVEELSPTEKLVILIVADSNKIKNTRLQKLSLIIKAALEGKMPESHGAYFFGGFSDEVEEGACALRDEGLLQHEPKNGFSLSPDGKKIAKFIEEISPADSKLVNDIVERFKSFSDSKLTAFTYVLFPELTSESVIKEKMVQLGNSLNLSEFRLDDKDKLKKLKEGLTKST